jgi:hypothetical protein
MEDDYTLQIDNALAMLAEKIVEINTRIDNLSTVDLPTDVIEMYAKAKVVDKYIAVGVPVNVALSIVGIEVDTDMLSNVPEKGVEQSEVLEGYQTTMRSLQSSIEALKAVFDYAKMYDDKEEDTKANTEGQMLVEEEDHHEENFTQKEGVSDEEEETNETDTDEKDSKED